MRSPGRLVALALALPLAPLGAGCADAGSPVGDAHLSPGPPDGKGPPRLPLVRPDTPGGGLQFDFEEGDVVESHPSPGGRFRVHFTRDGVNAVPEADADGSGVPDFVEQVATIYDDVLAAYQELGFRAPLKDAGASDDGGDDRFDVYLVDFAGVGDGVYRDDTCQADNSERCAGFMTQENDYAGYGYPSTSVANRILASHELFHAVQSAYDRGQGSVLGEGSAVWATERFDPSLGDLEAFVDGYLENPDRPIDEPLPGPVDPFSYGSAIFFQFLDEAYGAMVVSGLLEATENGAGGIADPYWLDQLGPVLEDQAGVTFAQAFTEFARWNLFTAELADPERGYARGDGYPPVRMDYGGLPHEDPRLRLYRASAQYVTQAPGGRAEVTAALVPEASAPGDAEGVSLLLVSVADDVITEVRAVADVTAGTETLDASGADRVVVVVVNGATEGDSKRPGLCIGTPDEVRACKETLAAQDPSGVGGAGGAGASTSTSSVGNGGSGGEGGADGGDDAGPGGSDDASSDDGCGCAVPGPPSRTPWAAALALGALLVRRRRPGQRWQR